MSSRLVAHRRKVWDIKMSRYFIMNFLKPYLFHFVKLSQADTQIKFIIIIYNYSLNIFAHTYSDNSHEHANESTILHRVQKKGPPT